MSLSPAGTEIVLDRGLCGSGAGNDAWRACVEVLNIQVFFPSKIYLYVLLENIKVNAHQARPLGLPALPCRGQGQALKLPRVDLPQTGGALAGQQGGGLAWTRPDLGTL